jgi:hypothetical protein
MRVQASYQQQFSSIFSSLFSHISLFYKQRHTYEHIYQSVGKLKDISEMSGTALALMISLKNYDL